VEQIKRIVDEDFSCAEKIILVMDHLNTHRIASLHETFPAEETFSIAQNWNYSIRPGMGSG
jgi:hypothetical protein